MNQAEKKTAVTLQGNQSGKQLSTEVLLRDDKEGQLRVMTLVEQCFYAMDTYGKPPSSIGDVANVFCELLGGHPAPKIEKAMATHLRRSSRFPTIADIEGLIKRNGRPPITDAYYRRLIAKEPNTRTYGEEAVIREYENELNQGW